MQKYIFNSYETNKNKKKIKNINFLFNFAYTKNVSMLWKKLVITQKIKRIND